MTLPRRPAITRWFPSRAIVIIAAFAAVPVVATTFPAGIRIPPRAARPTGPVPALFSHRTHAPFACYACHPGIFPQAAIGFSHTEMSDGRFCGGCHDGRLAFAVEGAACARCHVPR